MRRTPEWRPKRLAIMDMCLSCCLCHCRRHFGGVSGGHKFMHAVHKIQIKGAAAAAAAHSASDKYTF